MGSPKKKSPQEKLVEAIDRLTVQTERLERSVTTLTGLVGRVVFPAEAMQELTGCLRALVFTLDKNKEFIHLAVPPRTSPEPVGTPSSKVGG